MIMKLLLSLVVAANLWGCAALNPNSSQQVAWSTRMNDVVFIKGASGSGTGWFLADTNQQIVTAAHVVEGSENAVIYLRGDPTPYPAKVVRSSNNPDLALISPLEPLPHHGKGLPLCQHPGALGEAVFALGMPLGYKWYLLHGIVSQPWDATVPDSGPMMGIDVPIMPGNSGGPVMDATGQCVYGVVEMAIESQYFPGTLRFATPWQSLEEFLYGLKFDSNGDPAVGQ